MPGYPIVPWVFIVFAPLFLALTAYNDLVTYRAAVATGKPAMINSVFNVVLVLSPNFALLSSSAYVLLCRD